MYVFVCEYACLFCFDDNRILSKNGIYTQIFIVFSLAVDKICLIKEENFYAIKSFFREPHKLDMVKRKDIFPYKYLNSVERLKDTQLPPREKFYNILTDRNCSE